MASGYMFSHYWPGDGVQADVPVAATTQYNFPHWFSGSSVSMFGAGQVNMPKLQKWLRGLLTKYVWRKLHLRAIAAYYSLKLICSKDFTAASEAVRQVAQDPSTRNLTSWGDYNRVQISEPHESENVFRNFSARLILRSPQAGPLTELAWLAFKKRGR